MLRLRLVAAWMVALGGCANDDVGISGTGTASETGTDTDIGVETLSGSGATMTGATGTSDSAESSGSGETGTGMMTDSASTGPDVVCGDDAIGDGEVCDGSELGDETCESQGFAAGTLACLGDCSGYDTSGCSSCGNDAIDGDDVCDGSDLGSDCVTQGFDAGELACASDCSALDTTGCFDFTGACCETDDTPGCDNAACTAAVCADNSSCCEGAWDITCAEAAFVDPACVDAGGSCPVCGDGSAIGGELCDGADVLGQTCTSLGYDNGTVGCAADCASFDESACIFYMGDCCAADGTPGCDDSACTASVCSAMPSCCDNGWDDACAAAAFDDPACSNVGGSCPMCGDNLTEGPEACDGMDLLGEDCTDHGFDGGTLLCEVDCSALDLSECRDVGFGDCVNNPPGDVCLASEQCITDLAVPPTVGLCTDPDCMVASDCPLAPPGGDAPVLCVDVTGEGINECILFCALGQTCPTGMHCELDLACAWAAN